MLSAKSRCCGNFPRWGHTWYKPTTSHCPRSMVQQAAWLTQPLWRGRNAWRRDRGPVGQKKLLANLKVIMLRQWCRNASQYQSPEDLHRTRPGIYILVCILTCDVFASCWEFHSVLASYNMFILRVCLVRVWTNDHNVSIGPTRVVFP